MYPNLSVQFGESWFIYTVRWILPCPVLRHFCAQHVPSCLFGSQSLNFTPGNWVTCFLSLSFCLFWIFHINRITSYTTFFCDCFFLITQCVLGFPSYCTGQRFLPFSHRVLFHWTQILCLVYQRPVGGWLISHLGERLPLLPWKPTGFCL